jgi:hypothetical protein
MEIYQNPLFFHENIFFLIRKSLNTPNFIFKLIYIVILNEKQHLKIKSKLLKQYLYYN